MRLPGVTVEPGPKRPHRLRLRPSRLEPAEVQPRSPSEDIHAEGSGRMGEIRILDATTFELRLGHEETVAGVLIDQAEASITHREKLPDGVEGMTLDGYEFRDDARSRHPDEERCLVVLISILT